MRNWQEEWEKLAELSEIGRKYNMGENDWENGRNWGESEKNCKGECGRK